MKTLLILALLASTMISMASPIQINSYALPDDWIAPNFANTIKTPDGVPFVPYAFAAILTEEEIEQTASLFSTSTESTVKMPNGAVLQVALNPDHKPQIEEDIGISFSIEGPSHEQMSSQINLYKGSGVVLRFSKDENAKPQYLLFQIK